MSTRFEAEAILRAAASGAFPEVGDTLIRVQNGWVFGKVAISDLDGEIDPDQIDSLPFTKITGAIANGQVPESAVTQHEAALSLLFTQLGDQIADGQVPRSAVRQHVTDLIERVGWIDFLLSVATSTRPRSPAEKLYMAENYG